MLIKTSQLSSPIAPKAAATIATAAPASAAVEVPAAAPADSAQIGAEKPEPTTGEALKKWFFEVRRKGDKLEGAPFHKLAYGAVLMAGAYAALDVAMDIAGGGSVAGIATKVALNGAALTGGYLAADVASGLLHHWADNYADPESSNQFTRKFAKQAQRHHFHPTKLGNYTPSYWAAPLSLVAWAPLVATTALGLPAPVVAGTLGMIGGMIHYGNFHNWSHMKDENVPAVGKLLQKVGLAITKKDHVEHHNAPWNTDYCIVNGAMNKPLDALKFWPRYEKAVHALTGAEPESWKSPVYKAYADGEIGREEFESRHREAGKHFVTHELKARKEKWGIE